MTTTDDVEDDNDDNDDDDDDDDDEEMHKTPCQRLDKPGWGHSVSCERGRKNRTTRLVLRVGEPRNGYTVFTPSPSGDQDLQDLPGHFYARAF